MGEQLTEQDSNARSNIYSFIVDFITTHGYSPSIREIAAGTGIASTSTVKEQLYMLERLGKIRTQEYKSRTISLVGYKYTKCG